MKFPRLSPIVWIIALTAIGGLFSLPIFIHRGALPLPERTAAPPVFPNFPTLADGSVATDKGSHPTPVRSELPPSLSEDDRKKIEVVREILRSKNDNDWRLDRDFNGMNPAVKRALEIEYSNLPAEARNERGTLSFLLARDARGPEDLAFFRSLFSEAPCLSFEDCKKEPVGERPDHTNGMDDRTVLAYPQIIAFRTLRTNPSAEIRTEVERLLREQRSSKNPRLVEEALKLDDHDD